MVQKPHKNLECWIRARAFVKSVYEVTAAFPKDELFGMTSQLRRASVSIVANIAEGAARRTAMASDAEFRRFLNMAIGSASEVDTLILLCEDVGLISHDTSDALQQELESVTRPLYGLLKSLKP